MEQDFAVPLCLSMGNTKVGRVWTFSLPSFVTCPGASAWCRQHCYAARFEQIPYETAAVPISGTWL